MDLPASALLEAILEGTGHPILVLSGDGALIAANRAAHSWMETHPGLRTLIEQAVQGDRREFELQPFAFSIRPVSVQGTSSAIFIAEGLDVSEREAEKQRVWFAFEAANISSWSWDLPRDVVNTHSGRGLFGAEPYSNVSRAEAITNIHPDDRAYLLAEADGAVASRSGFRAEVRGVTPATGQVRWVTVSGTVRCNEAGEPIRVDGISTDITERKEAELRLRESEARFRAIFENAGIGIALVGADGVLVETNPVLGQLLGYSAAELQKMHFAEFTHHEDVDRDIGLYQDLFAGRRTRYEIEKRYIRKGGDIIWGKLVVSAVRDPSGTPLFGIGMVEDITHRKRVEQEVLSLSDKLINTQEQERSRIARELHDGLGQQIAALSIAVSSLKRQIPEQDEEPRARMERLQQRIAAISEGVRRISHELHPAVLELAGIVAALRSYCKQFSTDNRLDVSLEADGAFEDISADAALCLYRVAQEALQNVAKHSGAKEACVHLERAADAVLLTVTDHGRGFDADAPVLRTGLGLVSMKERARLLNGRLEILSAPGEGTTLRVSIPLAVRMSA